MSSRTFRFSLALILMPVAAGWASRAAPMTAAGKPAEVEVAPFLRAPAFDVRKLTSKPGQPSVAVAVDGTVLVFWGKRGLPYLFRSEDGGETWSDEITVTEDPNHAGSTGAAVVDELTGDVLIFCYRIGGVWMNGHSWRSRNHGKTWIDNGATDDIVKPNTAVLIDGIPSKPGRGMLSGNDSGITLRHGEHRGRLLISARNWSRPGQPVSSEERHSLAIYSDDGGRSWQTSGPFPAYGTGEAALEELSDGRIYYNSRRHWAPEGVNPRRRRWIAWSYDGGATWKDLAACAALPDGHTSGTGDPGLMGAVTRLPVRGRDILLFSNMDSPEGRRNGTVWVSFDGAKTWPLKRSVEAGDSSIPHWPWAARARRARATSICSTRVEARRSPDLTSPGCWREPSQVTGPFPSGFVRRPTACVRPAEPLEIEPMRCPGPERTAVERDGPSSDPECASATGRFFPTAKNGVASSESCRSRLLRVA